MSLKFPDPVAAVNGIGLELGTAPGSRLVDVAQAVEKLRAFQADTINAMADYLFAEARKFELTNKTVTFAELKAAGATLHQYAETLAPAAPEANR